MIPKKQPEPFDRAAFLSSVVAGVAFSCLFVVDPGIKIFMLGLLGVTFIGWFLATLFEE